MISPTRPTQPTQQSKPTGIPKVSFDISTASGLSKFSLLLDKIKDDPAKISKLINKITDAANNNKSIITWP